MILSEQRIWIDIFLEVIENSQIKHETMLSIMSLGKCEYKLEWDTLPNQKKVKKTENITSVVKMCKKEHLASSLMGT